MIGRSERSSVCASFTNYLTELWGYKKPLCAIFSTIDKKYLYDSGTNKILTCDHAEFDLLNYLLTNQDLNTGLTAFLDKYPADILEQTIKSLEYSIRNYNILKLTQIESLCMAHKPPAVIDKALHELKLMHLELTQECNFRCKYCVYNANFTQNRNHSDIRMSEPIARKAIDYLRNNSTRQDEVGVGFYGGEPLLQYSLLRSIVAYAKCALKNKQISFTITTNGSLIDEDIANFLFKENFGVLISIDGPEDIHNEWRVDRKGNETFERVYRGVKFILKRYRESLDKIGLSIVYAPPFSIEKIKKINNFIASLDIPQNIIRTLITYPHDGSIYNNPDLHESAPIDFSLTDYARQTLFYNYKKRIENDPITRGIMELKLAKLVKRAILDDPISENPLNGCCMPGSRKIYVTAKGELLLCERIGISPAIGNVYEGIDYKLLAEKYIEEYSQESLPDCSRCWLIRLCPICYQQAFYDRKVNITRKRSHCSLHRKSTLRDLADYCYLLEKDEKGLDYLYEWKIT